MVINGWMPSRWVRLCRSRPYLLDKWNTSHERRRGRVVRALGCGAEGHRFESRSGQKTGKLSLSTQQRMGTWSTSGKVKGGERRGLGPAFYMPCPRHDGSSNTPLPRRPLGYGHLYLFTSQKSFNRDFVHQSVNTFEASPTIQVRVGYDVT